MKRRFVLALLALFVIAIGLFRYYDRLPVIEWATQFHSQRGSIDCGHIRRYEGNAEAAIRCADAAYRSRRPFTVIFTGHGIDERISNALVADSDGHIIELFYATGMVTPRGLLKRRCEPHMGLAVEENSPYGFPRLHCAPWPPHEVKISRDFLLW